MEVQAGPKGLTLSCEVASGVPEVVVGDPVRLRQILVNLIGNAIKFTKAGGVEVKIGPGEPGSLHFSVKDTALG
ncbi:MAG: ATP-binding protein [Acidobacteriota bacterium]